MSSRTEASDPTQTQSELQISKITVIGTGTIGLSLTALLLTASPTVQITIYDTRAELYPYIYSTLPQYLPPHHPYESRLTIAATLPTAVNSADVVYECLPEKLPLKRSTWAALEPHAPATALFWSATSGIPASAQASTMTPAGAARLLVVHPYNPPHVMPLLEIVPGPQTASGAVERTLTFWRGLGREPVLVRREMPGFVANRLAFALFREAVHLVSEGVVSMEDCDRVVSGSMGPRWAVQGPFRSYHAGGGEAGLEGFMRNIGGTVGEVWEDLGTPKADGNWVEGLCREAGENFGLVDTEARDRVTRRILEVIAEEKEKAESGRR